MRPWLNVNLFYNKVKNSSRTKEYRLDYMKYFHILTYFTLLNFVLIVLDNFEHIIISWLWDKTMFKNSSYFSTIFLWNCSHRKECAKNIFQQKIAMSGDYLLFIYVVKSSVKGIISEKFWRTRNMHVRVSLYIQIFSPNRLIVSTFDSISDGLWWY